MIALVEVEETGFWSDGLLDAYIAMIPKTHRDATVIRSMIIPGASHGIEASFLADTSLRKLRTAIFLSCLV